MAASLSASHKSAQVRYEGAAASIRVSLNTILTAAGGIRCDRGLKAAESRAKRWIQGQPVRIAKRSLHVPAQGRLQCSLPEHPVSIRMRWRLCGPWLPSQRSPSTSHFIDRKDQTDALISARAALLIIRSAVILMNALSCHTLSLRRPTVVNVFHKRVGHPTNFCNASTSINYGTTNSSSTSFF